MRELPKRKDARPGGELRAALRRCKAPLAGVAAFSAVINILALTGSLYMLQVYDRVLPSHSVPTLIGLTVLMAGLYMAYGALDLLRTRIMSRIGFRFERSLRGRVFDTLQALALRSRQPGSAMQPVRDLEQIRGFLGSQGPIALFDLPWLPVYLALVYLLHPYLGLLATGGALVLVALTLITEAKSREPARVTAQSGAQRHAFTEATRRNAEIIRALGLGRRMADRWHHHNETAAADQGRALDVTTGIGTVSRVFRMVLQSALLGLGAYVVIRGEATGGVMIAASIMTARALAPIEIAIANWRGFIAARQSYARLGQVLAAIPAEEERTPLPRPAQSLAIAGLTVTAPGEQRAILQNIAFTLNAGEGLGVIGPSASGKSTLARAIVGAWGAQRGTIRLDGATLDQYGAEALGRDIGYLPQDIELFDGSVAENIARFDPEATADAIMTAARAAGVHEMILHLPEGYDTRIGEAGAMLSAGQRQRIGLARALYGAPFLVVLDEPNSNLDAEGETALSTAIASVRARGGIAIVIAHRPSALAAVDRLAMIASGQIQAFGPRDEVLAKVLQQPASATAPAAASNVIQPLRMGGHQR